MYSGTTHPARRTSSVRVASHTAILDAVHRAVDLAIEAKSVEKGWPRGFKVHVRLLDLPTTDFAVNHLKNLIEQSLIGKLPVARIEFDALGIHLDADAARYKNLSRAWQVSTSLPPRLSV